MCGITGIFHYAEQERPVDRELLLRMTRSLEHRGPDDEGFYFDGSLGLGHRRLSIVDVSAAGHQPMPNHDRSCWITYNGEFYNHLEFRRRLLARGQTFRSTSDTETLLHLFAEEGADCLPKVYGIFAFAFWDANRRELTLVRDLLGVKQLYYHDDGRRIVFASEIKALLECPDVPRELDAEALNEYLHFHTALFDRTFFKGVRQLRAGEVLRIARSGIRRRVLKSVDNFEPRGGTPEQSVEELNELLGAVVKEQLLADVPVGSFFSGGIDSSAIAATAAKTGMSPTCFGVHFTDQGVVDERPYQEAAARALGLDLHLVTLDGSSFGEDLMRLIYYQDEPVIGAAMFPMYAVSRLASKHVKVCLGGQAADEVFGGYARYGLVNPWHTIKSSLAPHPSSNGHSKASNGRRAIGGNLWLQVADRQNLRRLIGNISHATDWQSRYFEHFAKVPESEWRSIFGHRELVSRRSCYELFRETVNAYPTAEPADKAMHWDMQTYLTGLFHQDDRMSMACSLESRVPMADLRLVQFAFHCGFDLKFRSGSTKWILRQAVADVLPPAVLNRRKIGFDTPAERWMRSHKEFVRDLLLSTEARSRGIWNSKKLEALIENARHPRWFDIVWKAVCIEAWAQTFLKGQSTYSERYGEPEATRNGRDASPAISIRHTLQEVRELGIGGTIFRTAWELKQRSGLAELLEQASPRWGSGSNGALAFEQEQAAAKIRKIPFTDPHLVAEAMRERIPADNLSRLRKVAIDAARGNVLCFGRWTGDYGRPIDWQLNPTNGKRWNEAAHWSKALRDEEEVGDIKLTWEVARFPHAYHMARAAAFMPDLRSELAEALAAQIKDFVRENPFGKGVHWNSGQEIAIRQMAWMFGTNLFLRLGAEMKAVSLTLIRSAFEGAVHIERNLEYAYKAVYNNHLLSESLALYLIAQLWPGTPEAGRWADKGLTILESEVSRQFYTDGGYIQQSNNYHRVAAQVYLWAWMFLKSSGHEPPPAWRQALECSLDFLVAQQNPVDGRLPNYGANDGALPSVLSTCDFSDFRPALQAISFATRGERIYEPGPWDETAAWLFGVEALDAPKRNLTRKSVSFAQTGTHVLRGQLASSFGVFRCGTLRDRFSQIDMLHLDVWWRGLNVLADGGSYLYNGAEKWHRHFLRTGSHNTLQVDGHDQMLHYRRFKNLYWTKARLLQFIDEENYALCSGEHYGFERHEGNAVHRRSVLFVKDDLWIVVDRVTGSGEHQLRLHWLCEDFPYECGEEGRLVLKTPQGAFSLLVCNTEAQPLYGNVARGQEEPPQGWLSRYYGEKIPVPSLAVTRQTLLPAAFISILGAGSPVVEKVGEAWSVRAGDAAVTFSITDGLIVPQSFNAE